MFPDWSREQCLRLLARPVFDPATLGRVRLHNDNEGHVRGYLAARWLKRLSDSNAPARMIQDLLFADIYGLQVIKPSLREVSAWLSIWNEGVARETLARDPLLLLDAGDPGSLGPALRKQALHRIMGILADEPAWLPIFDHESIRRFANAKLADTIQNFWDTCKDNSAIRRLLLMLVWLC